MKTLERLLRHDAWTTRMQLTLSAGLSDDEIDREFDIGHRSLRRTFTHMIVNMECWCDLMTGKPRRSQQTTSPLSTIVELTDRLDIVAEQLLALGKSVEDGSREDDSFVDYLNEPPRRKPLGAGMLHIATHGMHHRAHCLYIMRQLGMKNLIEGDALSWEKTYLGLHNWPTA